MASSGANVPSPGTSPPAEPIPTPNSPTVATPATPVTPQRRSRTSTNASTTSASSRIRAASLKFIEATPPPGMWAATGTVAAKAPTLGEIRTGSFGTTGWNEEPQRYKAGLPRRRSSTQMGTSQTKGSPASPTAFDTEPFPAVTEEEMYAAPLQESCPAADTDPTPTYDKKDKDMGVIMEPVDTQGAPPTESDAVPRPLNERKLTYGYVPPPKVPWTRSTAIALTAFWKWFLTPAGFIITIYCLNVVAWGGMLFLLLCNAAPAMCKPSCDDIQSPRRIWIEIDSQILNALFCVTGFGLAPWRFRDLYWWGWWRLGGTKRKEIGIRRLAGIHRGWFRLPGSDALPPDVSVQTVSPEDPAVPIPIHTLPDPPPTGIHAPPTKSWKMDFVLWMNAWNTFFQVVLCFYMWHYNRHTRPSWATGLFVAMACIVAGIGGIMMFHEGKYIKKVEGVPVPKGFDEREIDPEAFSTKQPVQPAPDGAAKEVKS